MVGGSGWETHVNPWLIHGNVWQKPLQYCKVISLQLIKINGKKQCFIGKFIRNCIIPQPKHMYPFSLFTFSCYNYNVYVCNLMFCLCFINLHLCCYIVFMII